MTFLGWLLMGGGVVFMYAAIRGLNPICVVQSAIQGKASNCTQ